MSRRVPKYQRGQRTIAPLSDGRTPGVCSACGKQHPPAKPDWETNPDGCNDPRAVFTVKPDRDGKGML